MKRINNSNFELIQDILSSLDIKYNSEHNQILDDLDCYWNEIIGNKISKFSKVYEISADNTLTIVCADSFITNELYFAKDKLLNKMNEKASRLGIKVKDIRFDYKKWKEKNNE